ncbi:hypothetical protein HK44_006695 [Pseudomonas fluorescens HK44]|uniref:Uncharacterized protein n=1 Tax=Pseudomonas fluorescens HK44 TaxID=1042209 RepID=A0A010RZE7_PSEFL|nr:hypothetical protein HK44_006695 [Pseudomonas fluorescens HK44]
MWLIGLKAIRFLVAGTAGTQMLGQVALDLVKLGLRRI